MIREKCRIRDVAVHVGRDVHEIVIDGVSPLPGHSIRDQRVSVVIAVRNSANSYEANLWADPLHSAVT